MAGKSRPVSWNQGVDLPELGYRDKTLLFGIQVASRFNTAIKMLVTASMLHSRFERTTALNMAGLVSWL